MHFLGKEIYSELSLKYDENQIETHSRMCRIKNVYKSL